VYRDDVFIYQRRKYMARQDKDDEREERIRMEIIADAYGPEEQALGWYNYLADTLHFPFTVHCVALRAISPLEPGDELDVVGIAPEEECRHEMFVMTRWRPHELAVPLMQLEGIHVDEETQQAIEDWRYWVNQGYEL
jgi:Calcium binding